MAASTSSEHPNLLPRQALVERLARADARAIVSAPPGFGKSTLLEAWSVHRRALVVSLAGVGAREAAAVAQEVAEAGLSRPSKPLRIPRIAFDDVAAEAVARVVTAVPANVGLVVATRAAVVERAAFRDVIDIRALTFRGEELAREVGVVRARGLVATTGGWPALVGAVLAGEELEAATARALGDLSAEVQRFVGRLAAFGTGRRAFLQLVAPGSQAALGELIRLQLATPESDGDGGIVEIFGDALSVGRRCLAEAWAAREPAAYRELQRRIAELLGAGTKAAPAELAERIARLVGAGDAARVGEILARYGPQLDDLASATALGGGDGRGTELRSATLAAWADFAAGAAPTAQVLARLARARIGRAADVVGPTTGDETSGDRGALGWRWRARLAEAEAFRAWGAGRANEALRFIARARAELVGVRVDDADADVLERRWRLFEARCVRESGPWERARGLLRRALEAVAEARGPEARAIRGLLAASAIAMGDAKTLARVAQGGDQVAKIAWAWAELLVTGDVATARTRLASGPFEPWAHALAQLARGRLGLPTEREAPPAGREEPRGDLLRELAAGPGGGRWDKVAEAVRGLAEADAAAVAALKQAASAGGFEVPWGLAPAGVLEQAAALAAAHIGDAAWVVWTRGGQAPLDDAAYADYAAGRADAALVVVAPESRVFVAGVRHDRGQKRVMLPLLLTLLAHPDSPLSVRELAAAVWRVRSPHLKPAVQTKIKVAVSRLRALLGGAVEVVVTTKKSEGGAEVAAYQIAPELTFVVVAARADNG